MSKQSLPVPSMTALAPAAARQALAKLAPRLLLKNPVIFATAVVAAMVTLLGLRDLATGVPGAGAAVQIAVWLWAAVLISNFAEALAEGRGRARADSLRATKTDTMVRVLASPDSAHDSATMVSSATLKRGQILLVVAGDIIPADADVVQGVASVDESAITGESAPVIRESGGDFSSVTGGTRIVSDWLVLRVTSEPGRSFLDRMIALVEGAERAKTPNEIALNILLAGLTLIFLLVVVTLEPFARYSGTSIPVVFLAALFVTLIPTTIGGLLSAIGIAGMDRLARANVVAKSGRAVEAAGDVDVLLLDKTGTITFGNRMADALIPAQGVSEAELARAALVASRADDTPEGKSIVELARKLPGANAAMADVAEAIAFSAQARLSGADLTDGTQLRKGSVEAILRQTGAAMDAGLAASVDQIARSGGTPLLVSQGNRIMGAVHLKDIIKPGVRERFAELRAMGIRTVMITGDNPLTAAAIAAEAGVDDFLAEATPEAKLELIRSEQAKGQLVAMCGDGSNDAPALAQADVGVAMNSGTSAAKEAANLIDLDSDPTKLIEVVLVGKQLLISRGALTTFSIANDVAKYFAILPALFIAAYPGLAVLNLMGLQSASSAILSAVIFNALVILALIPLALRGVKYAPSSAAALLRRNLTIYGLGGLIVPFLGIKVIDAAVNALGLV
ncbi:potassium-transporting ATPase subunit KdpB [Paracoccus gahaiensis]|uniref:Potassium-transporting ATPase ATP-binding subunit n=1 Tax=Paracoccus gahaiensis TaxID=1706839 RepID=A0A4V5MUT3_9RHOB|nr:potassium-transporting ATPase subunit KdpB [Paracoccus gahaiensis]TJZ89528.1 potassium-transporting ATPase subunit KdpB [Paracoccus gahaiensis]